MLKTGVTLIAIAAMLAGFMLSARYLNAAIPPDILQDFIAKSPGPLMRHIKQVPLSHLSYCNPRPASLGYSLKWFTSPGEKYRALVRMTRGIEKPMPAENQTEYLEDAGATFFSTLQRMLGIGKARLARAPRKGWHLFQQAGLSKNDF